MSVYNKMNDHHKLKRLGHQLALSEHLLQTHPFVKDKLSVLQTVLHYLNLQMQWNLAGSPARLLMTFRAALQAQEIEKSQTGFIGPAFSRLQEGIARLMHASLRTSERELTSILLTFTQVMTLTAFFTATQLVENWKRLFPQDDPAAAQKAGLLLRELGLTFVLGSRAIEIAFRSICQGLNLKEDSQKRITDIGMFFLLSLLILIEEQDHAYEEEFFDTVKRFLKPTLESVEYALHEAQAEHLFEQQQAELALNQFQFIQSALNSEDEVSFKQSLVDGLEAFGLSYQEVKGDLKRLIIFCSQLNESFRNIFYQTNLTATTVIQAA